MQRNSKFWKRRDPKPKTISCSCGSQAKLSSKTNYPFGRKSKPVRTMNYICKNCRKRTIVNKDSGGKK